MSILLVVKLFHWILALDVNGYWQEAGAFYEYQAVTCSATLPLYAQLSVCFIPARKLKLEAVVTAKAWKIHILPFLRVETNHSILVHSGI